MQEYGIDLSQLIIRIFEWLSPLELNYNYPTTLYWVFRHKIQIDQLCFDYWLHSWRLDTQWNIRRGILFCEHYEIVAFNSPSAFQNEAERIRSKRGGETSVQTEVCSRRRTHCSCEVCKQTSFPSCLHCQCWIQPSRGLTDISKSCGKQYFYLWCEGYI